MAYDTAPGHGLGQDGREPVPAALYDLEAEQGVLGVALARNDYVSRADGLLPRHFHEPFHQRLWAKIGEKTVAGVSFDAISLNAAFEGDPAYAELGGLGYLGNLVNRAPPAPVLTEYAKVIVDRASRRDLVAAAEKMIAGARDIGTDLRETVTGGEAAVVDIARGSEPGDANLVDAKTAADMALVEMRQEAATGRPKGLMTGLRCVDCRLRGLRPGIQIVIAGRPSMGKSGLARQIFHGAAKRNPDYLFPFFCVEMNLREMTERTLSELTYRDGMPIQYRDMNPEKFTPMDWDVMERAARRVPANFILDATATLTVDYVRRRAWALRRKGPIGAIAIDYLQIMQRPPAQGRNEASVIGDMTASLKRLARELDCAVVLLSQVNRAVESRDDKRPQISDLKESGSIEQDANVVLFPFREVYYVERAEPKAGTPEYTRWETEVAVLNRRMDVICAKNRGGAIGTDVQDYHAEYDAVTDQRSEP
ncbi:DnaB-like helicase C-terminal domain-containing protein [Paraburkholderia fungorum]|uniref:DnaB-like helicase C-terminal domain-containing protein n=1 Tax=Paraburkholderia fungorum TaxID=134537 RepID=UPI003D6BD4D2